MRTLTYYTATSLDGCIAEPDGADPSASLFTVGEDYLAHVVAHYPETLPTPARAGRQTLLPDRPGRGRHQRLRTPAAPGLLPHPRPQPDPGVELVATDPVETVQRLKTEPGLRLWLVGGAELAGALYHEIDELILKINPVTARAGIPLFTGKDEPSRRRFTRSEHVTLDSASATPSTRQPTASPPSPTPTRWTSSCSPAAPRSCHLTSATSTPPA